MCWFDALVKVWVDCTAAAHPIVLRPIIERLIADGHEVAVTTRSYGQTEGLLERLGIPYESIGAHGGASKFGKVRALLSRSRKLSKWAKREQPDLALAHGSVDIALVSRRRCIPLVQMNDYEHAGWQRRIAFRAAALVLAPDAIPVEAMEKAGAHRDRLYRYAGLKEDYYLADFEPDDLVLAELGIDRNKRLVVLRPPPETSEYHRDNPLYEELIERLAAETVTTTVVIPRTERQGLAARAMASPALIVPQQAIDAQSLIAFADLVVSAGGTMNREAVALGTPVYTIFAGEQGAVDAELIAAGLLRPLDRAEDLVIEPRTTPPGALNPRDPGPLADAIEGVVSENRPG
jgi:predicted glycosyltransferase